MVTAFAVFHLSFFAGIWDKPVSGVENGTNDINGTFIFTQNSVTFKYMNWNDGLLFLKR